MNNADDKRDFLARLDQIVKDFKLSNEVNILLLRTIKEIELSCQDVVEAKYFNEDTKKLARLILNDCKKALNEATNKTMEAIDDRYN